MEKPTRSRVASLAGVLLIATATGCIHITMNIMSPPSQVKGGNGIKAVDDENPPPTGGVFVPSQAARITGAPATICEHPISDFYVRFSNPYLWQTTLVSTIGFQGRVVNTNTGMVISNTDYYLQYYHNVATNGCCTNVPGSLTDVTYPMTPNRRYRFTAHFKPGKEPPAGHQIQVQGTWLE